MNTTAYQAIESANVRKASCIGQSAAKHPSDRMKVQRIGYTVCDAIPYSDIMGYEVQIMKTHECAATKVCKKCGKEKPVSEYRIQRVNRSNGVYSEWTLGKCRACERAYLNARNEANRDRQNAESRASYQRNKEKVIARTSAYYRDNRDRYVEWRKIRKQNETAEQRQDRLDQQREWRNSRKEKTRARWSDQAAKRKAVKMQATPKWANFDRISEIYAEAQARSIETGIVHHVDHIVPLVNDSVCGLHCPDNLRIVTAGENQCKSNKLVDDICCTR